MRHLRLINSDVILTNMTHLQVKVGSMGYDFYDGQFVSASACDAMPEIALDTFEGFLGKRHGCIFWGVHRVHPPGRLLVDPTANQWILHLFYINTSSRCRGSSGLC